MKEFFTKERIDKILPIMLALFLLLMFRSCDSQGLRKSVVKLQHKVDSLLVTQVDNITLTKQLKIEGLKAEKRMIQATDRKMLDVQRQTAIDAELKSLGQ